MGKFLTDVSIWHIFGEALCFVFLVFSLLNWKVWLKTISIFPLLYCFLCYCSYFLYRILMTGFLLNRKFILCWFTLYPCMSKANSHNSSIIQRILHINFIILFYLHLQRKSFRKDKQTGLIHIIQTQINTKSIPQDSESFRFQQHRWNY